MNFVKSAITAAALAFAATAAVAQTTPAAPVAPKPVVAAPAVAPPAAPAAATTAKGNAANLTKARTPESLACSAEADKANVHGKKTRGPYMKKCIAAKMAAKKN